MAAKIASLVFSFTLLELAFLTLIAFASLIALQVLRVKKQQLLAEKGRETVKSELKAELDESQEELGLATAECKRLKSELEKAEAAGVDAEKKAKGDIEAMESELKQAKSLQGEKEQELHLATAEAKVRIDRTESIQ
jgi:hypothetical protein